MRQAGEDSHFQTRRRVLTCTASADHDEEPPGVVDSLSAAGTSREVLFERPLNVPFELVVEEQEEHFLSLLAVHAQIPEELSELFVRPSTARRTAIALTVFSLMIWPVGSFASRLIPPQLLRSTPSQPRECLGYSASTSTAASPCSVRLRIFVGSPERR